MCLNCTSKRREVPKPTSYAKMVDEALHAAAREGHVQPMTFNRSGATESQLIAALTPSEAELQRSIEAEREAMKARGLKR
jgi:hypothetical protein